MTRFRLLVVRTVKEYSSDNCSQMAAAISYYVLFSLFPLLIFTAGILGLVLRDAQLQHDLVEAVLDNIPLNQEQGRDDVTQAVENIAGVSSGALGILGLLGMAWSGSNMFGVIRRSLNVAYDLDLHRPFVQQKLLDLGMVLGFAPFFLTSLVATAVLRIARQASAEVPIIGPASQSLGFGWNVVSLLIPITMSLVAFAFLYWIVPNTRVRLIDVWPGALLAAVLFEASKVAFGVYLENFSNYDVVFGSLGAVVAFLFWVYVSANIMLLGAEVASEYPRLLRGDYDQPSSTSVHKPLKARLLGLLRGLVVHPSGHAAPSNDKDG